MVFSVRLRGISPGARIRGVLALLVGLPVTIFYGVVPSILIAYLLSNGGPSSWNDTALLVACVVGLASLLGFWTWVFARRPMRCGTRVFVIVSLVGGLCLILAIVLRSEDPTYTAIGSAGLAVGLAICMWLLVPSLPFNPDGKRKSNTK